jgi:dihydroneopterin aldolase
MDGTMTSEIKQAFAHPEVRSQETAGDEPLDRISVRNHVVEVEIGAFQIERGITQRLSFDIVVEVRPSSGSKTDDVDDILSYDRVTEAISAELAHERLNLLETLAERIAGRILHEPQSVRVFVRIEKLDRGASDLGVEIVRSKAEATTSEPVSDAPSVIVLHVPSIDMLRRRLEEILAIQHPVILTVEKPTASEDLLDESVKRRIDLLSLSQEAWRMSALHSKLVVVDTWTELDWGLKNGQISLWAPAKVVVDSIDPSIAGVSEALVLSKWLARVLGAQRHVVLDATTTLANI